MLMSDVEQLDIETGKVMSRTRAKCPRLNHDDRQHKGRGEQKVEVVGRETQKSGG